MILKIDKSFEKDFKKIGNKNLKTKLHSTLKNIQSADKLSEITNIKKLKGTRITIQSLFDWLKTETLDDFLENFPTVSKQQALEVLRLAEKLVTDEKVLNENPT